MKKELITYFDPKSPVSEMFRTLRTNLQYMNAVEELKVLAITSTSRKKSYINRCRFKKRKAIYYIWNSTSTRTFKLLIWNS